MGVVLLGLSSLTLVVAVISISMIGSASGSTTLTAAQQSKNATACKFFEDGYNQLADAVRLRLSNEYLLAAYDTLPSRVNEAADRAEGDVALALSDMREFAPRLRSSEEAGLAYFITSKTVAEKCQADGVTIDLHKLE